VCILLIGFLLYNPFFALIHSPAGVSLRNLARNRATVGSGELDHFSPVAKQLTQGFLSVEFDFLDLLHVQKEIVYRSAADFETPHLSAPALTYQLWFRPPPSA
jgi:hypothetical protein